MVLNHSCLHGWMHVGVIIFCSVQTEIFLIKKTETGSNRFGSVFSVLARFFRFGSVFSGFFRFGFGSVFQFFAYKTETEPN
jgi:hypothetical protein